MDCNDPYVTSADDNEVEDYLLVTINDIIDEVTLGLCFDVHRSCKMGTLFLGDTDPKSQKEHEIVDRPGVDVFGNVPAKKQLECICPNCQRNLAASRFAPHLEKCMGMGRNSSRIASRRSQKALKENEASLLKGDSGESDNDFNDVDWTLYQDKKIRRLKKEKRSNSPKRYKNSKVLKNGSSSHMPADPVLAMPDPKTERADTPDSLIGFSDHLSTEEKKNIFISSCGVISEHTKKMCTRSQKCPQHTDEQRRQVRQFLLGAGISIDDDDQIDIDSYEDGDSQSLRESLQWEVGSTTSSPTDSTSTNNSATIPVVHEKKERKRHGKSHRGFGSKKRKTSKGHHGHSSIAVDSNSNQLTGMF